MRRLIALFAFLALSNVAWAFPFTYQGSLEDEGAPAVGSTIHARPREDRLHWFDAESGQRVES